MHASLSLITRRSTFSDHMSYIARVFEEAGWIGRQAILMTGINSVIYILSTIPPSVFSPAISRVSYLNLSFSRWYLVDRWGRRAILLSGAVVVNF